MTRSLSAVAALHLLAGSAIADDWIEAKSEHFVVLTDAGKGRARDALRDLEQLRRLIIQSLPSQPVESHIPTAIYLFESEKSMRPFQPLRDGNPEDWAGIFRPTSFKNFIASLASGSKEGVRELLFGQYLHLLMSYTDVDYPLWLRNGISLFYGNAHVTKEYGEIGKMHQRHRRELGEFRKMPLDQLFAVAYDSPVYRGAGRALFDAQSWALVHYLLVGRNPEGAQALANFLGLLAEGKNEVLAFQEALAMPLPEIESEIGQYIRKRISQYMKVPLPPMDLDEDFLVTELPAPAVEARLGELLVAMRRYQDARARLNAAVEADADLVEAYEGLGFLDTLAGNRESARTFLERAVERGSSSPMVHLHFAQALLDEYRGPVADVPAAVRSKALASLRRTLDAEPSHTEAARLYGFLCLFGDAEVRAKGLEVVTGALEVHRGNAMLLLILGQLHARQGDLEAAKTIFESLLTRKLAPELVAEVRRQLDYVLVNLEGLR